MNHLNPGNKYKQNAIFSATPMQLTIMLYDALIAFIEQSRDACMNREHQLQHVNMTKAQNIVLELMGSLDGKASEEISQALYSLYQSYYIQLVEANLKNDTDSMNSCLCLIKDMRNGWSEVEKELRIASVESRGDGDEKAIRC